MPDGRCSREGNPASLPTPIMGWWGRFPFTCPKPRRSSPKSPWSSTKPAKPPITNSIFGRATMTAKAKNAVFVRELDRRRQGDPPIPPELQREFESVTDLGVRDVLYHGRVLRPLQIYACRGLR